jgi:uncharacterized protein YndB with AHSA1/START domain
VAGKSTAQEKANPELTITRILDASRKLVFNAWIDPKHVAQWRGAHGFTNPVCELDLRPGPDGIVYPMTGAYQEVVEPERLVFTSAALDLDGNPMFEVLNTMTFAEEGGKTKQIVRARVIKKTAQAAPYLAGREAVWTQSLERLAACVATESKE